MVKQEPKVDAYIEKANDFAKPILNHLRKLIHKACPEVEETIKWGMPNFGYTGTMMCNMAAFKAHCAFGFWKGKIMKDPHGIITDVGNTGMGSFGKITSLHDLPEDQIIIDYIKEAMVLNEKGIKVPKKPTEKAKKELVTPDYLSEALKRSKKARETWDGFSYSHHKEYIEWLTEAKTEATRLKRLDKTIELLEEGKQRHWKYQKK